MRFLSILPRLSCLHRQSLYACSAGINVRLRNYGMTPHPFEANNAEPSIRFPNYHVIYEHQAVRLYAAVHSLKKFHLIVSTILVVLCASNLPVAMMPINNLTESVVFCLLSGIALHIYPMFWNNEIVYVYHKEEDDSVIISYISYWGRRVDVKTSQDKMPVLKEQPKYKKDAKHYKLRLPGGPPLLPMKIFKSHGAIYNYKKFQDIFGVD